MDIEKETRKSWKCIPGPMTSMFSNNSIIWSTEQGFMLQMKYRERVLGLILVSPLCKAPSWSEWIYNKVLSSDLIVILTSKHV